MKVHFIAIGGAAMHNLAIALVQKGFTVTGSDDEIYEPSLSRLKKHNILPAEWGWFPKKINADLDAIVLGMHARADNAELVKAQEIGLKIYSYPEFLYEQTKNKKRVVIGGSHGKTTVTSMIMHVLKESGRKFDFMVGALIDGFDVMVNLDDKNEIAVFEGDEYLASPIDRRPKFHLYHPHIAVLTGIAWDHMNVFPTFENYVEQFSLFLDTCEPHAKIFYSAGDDNLKNVCENKKQSLSVHPYEAHAHLVRNEKTVLLHDGTESEIKVFGKHNMLNLQAAYNVCNELGITKGEFYRSIASFKGASKRLEYLHTDENLIVLRDFAHSPSKLKATINAVKEQYPNHNLIAAFELHTFSSLNPAFLGQYAGTMNEAPVAMVYFNPQTLEHKKLPPLDAAKVQQAFARNDVKVFTDENLLVSRLKDQIIGKICVLFMSSGTFNGVNLNQLACELAGV
jgi:UDP-N-acetylmuramate: L-alanyl-gamma-D-glutamyl-meso-diaminopimelate ligase